MNKYKQALSRLEKDRKDYPGKRSLYCLTVGVVTTAYLDDALTWSQIEELKLLQEKILERNK